MIGDTDYTEDQAARILGVSTKTLRRWRSQGSIDYIRMPGGRIRYAVDQLTAFRARCRIAATNVQSSPGTGTQG